MKQPSLFIYRSANFDGNLYVKAVGIAEWGNCQITLVKDNENLATLQGTTGIFTNQGYGQYQAVATVGNQRDSSIMLTSKTIDLSPTIETQRDPINAPCTVTTNTIKSLRQRFDGIDEYYLYFRLKSAQDIARLQSAIASYSSTLSCLKNSIILSSVQNHLLGDMLPNTYKIHCEGDYDELVRIADALELLDYVVYCSVTPNTHSMKPPHLSPNQLILDERNSSVASVTQEAQTPNFQPLQTYLQPSSDTIRGMNVLSVWEHGEIGQAATVRHLDYGVYRDHENLKGNINVVHSRPETEDCNHGTASTGCIVAANKPFGVAGIAHGSDFYFYDTGDIELIIRDAMPGDIVSLDIQFEVEGSKLVPVITDRNWWDWIYSLTQNGVVVILAAANGGLDLSNESGNINYYGDSGSTLIGACAHNDGSRCSFSNYNHPSSFINSWGDWSVVTTGYSSLQSLPGNNRNYTKDYSGTSSATPLSSGALALIQSYAINHLGLYLNSLEMRELISKTGYLDNAGDNIGCRPNVDAAIRYLQENQPAIISAVIDGPAVVTQKEEVNLSAERSVSNVAALTAYAWQLPESISAEVVDQPTLRFYAPAVVQPQEVLIKLTVTDALGNSADATHALLINPEASTQYPLWDATKVYWAGDKVSWKNQHWQAKWWNVNIEPEETGTIYPGPWGKID